MYNTKIFASLCARINDYINRRKLIDEGTLMDFSRLSIKLIQDLPETMPSEYDYLQARVSDYWLYEIENDYEDRRISDYIRIFQIMLMIKIAIKERDGERQIVDDLKRNYYNYKILQIIYDNPGLTCKKIHEQLDVSIEDILRQTAKLAEKGYLIFRRKEAEQYYMLTTSGEIVFKRIKDSIDANHEC